MGVAFLWNILEPVKRHVPLDDLRGKTLAVDLSLWVCEAQTVKQMIGVVTKPHLRNLFFRVSSLTLMGVRLLFVMEGEAPKVKAETMMIRNEMRYGPSRSTAPSRPGRSYFTSVLKECLRLLDCLGIPWVQAAGEAEAMCAYLNANGYVDGCITNDGDVFLYGAQTVYRNFTMNVKDPHVDCYKTESIKETLGLDRDALIGIAILLGCDYLPKGTPGVGKNQVLKLIQTLNGQNILKRFDQWAEQFQNGKNTAPSTKKVTHCNTCCHPGSTKDHERRGCSLCGSKQYCEPHDYSYLCPCPWHQAQRDKKNNALENTIKRRARACSGFPFREVIEEFHISKDKLVKRISWLRPNILFFQNFAYEKMEWPKHYSCEKVFVLLTYYDMTERAAGRVDSSQLKASRIVKMRVRNGIPCFEIQWEKPEHYVFTSEKALESFPVSIEEVSLFQASYPEIAALYKKEQLENEDKKLKGKKSKPQKKELADPDDIAEMIRHLSLQPETQTISSSVPDVQESCEDCSESEFEVKPLRDRINLQKKQKELQKVSTSLDDSLKVFLPHEKRDTSPTLSTVNTAGQTHVSPNSLTSPSKVSKECPIVPSPTVSSVISDLHLSSIDWEVDVFVPDAEVGSSHPPPTVNMAEQIHTSVKSLDSPAQVNNQCLDTPSPSISAVISELQLSSIDWDSSSFCSSPLVEAPARSIAEAISGKQEAANCGNFANQPQSRAAKSNIENIPPTSHQKPLDRSSVNSIPNEEIVAGNLHRRPLAERVLLKNSQLSCPKPQKEWGSKPILPNFLHLAECKKQVAYSWTGKSSTPRSLFTWESEKKLPSKQGQRSTAASQVGVPKKSVTAAHIMEKITNSNELNARVQRIESIKSGAALVSSSLKASAVQVKEVSAVTIYGNMNNKACLNALTKKSVCHKPLNSSSDDSDSGDMRSNVHTLNVKRKENGASARLLLPNKFADKLVGSITQKKTNGCKEERVDFQLPTKHFDFDNIAVLSISRTSAAPCSNEIRCGVHRTLFLELPSSPEAQSIEEESVICDSPLPLSERIKMRLL